MRQAHGSKLLHKLRGRLTLFWTAARGWGLAPPVAVIVAVVITVGGGAPIEDVERNVARRRAEHHQVALAQRGLVVTAVTESTLLQKLLGVNQDGWS